MSLNKEPLFQWECWKHGTFALFAGGPGCAYCGKKSNNIIEKVLILPILHTFRRIRYILTHTKLRHVFQKIKWFIQRGSRGYADCDVWDLDDYLCGWMPDAIGQLGKYGYPANLTEEKWEKIKSDMQEGFKAHRIIVNLDCEIDEIPKYEKIANKGLKLFIKHFGNLWN